MGSFLKKAKSIIKVVLPFLLDNWKTIATCLSGITISGILAGLGNFIDALSHFTSLTINYDIHIWLIIAILPYLLYIAVVMPITKMINKFRKPAYLKFTTMEYLSTKNQSYKLEWNYVKDKKEYVPRNVHAVCHKCGCELAKLNSEFIYCPLCRQDFCEPITEYDSIYTIIKHKTKGKLF
jgi:hypothetical protein